MNCPKCGSVEVRPSRDVRWADRFQLAFGREAFRCRECRERFFASRTAATYQTPKHLSGRRKSRPLLSVRTRRRLTRRLIALAVFAVAFALFWMFLRYMTQLDPQPSSRLEQSQRNVLLSKAAVSLVHPAILSSGETSFEPAD